MLVHNTEILLEKSKDEESFGLDRNGLLSFNDLKNHDLQRGNAEK